MQVKFRLAFVYESFATIQLSFVSTKNTNRMDALGTKLVVSSVVDDVNDSGLPGNGFTFLKKI